MGVPVMFVTDGVIDTGLGVDIISDICLQISTGIKYRNCCKIKDFTFERL